MDVSSKAGSCIWWNVPASVSRYAAHAISHSSGRNENGVVGTGIKKGNRGTSVRIARLSEYISMCSSRWRIWRFGKTIRG